MALTLTNFVQDQIDELTATFGVPGAVSMPIGSFYTQYPAADSNTDSVEFPESERPATLFGGTWTEQWPTESIFFRTRGTLSDTDRVDGKQDDQCNSLKTVKTSTSSPSTEVTVPDDGSYSSPVTLYAGGSNRNLVFAKKNVETRAVNRRIKVWKRTA